jgi:GntR family transcriptional regulator / MocR family aminotransferase
MDLHIVLDQRKPLRRQLEEKLRSGIRTGRLQPGSRLPASRLLAAELGVSRGVVLEAYSQLKAEGYLATHGSGGTRVAKGAALTQLSPRRGQASRRIRFDLRAGMPDTSLFPRRAWRAAISSELRELPDAALQYGPTAGQLRMREAIVAYFGRVRAVVGDPENLFVTCGSSHALALLWTALRSRGVRRVAHEDPVWKRVPETILGAGLEAVPVGLDGRGISVADIYAADVDAVVVSPAHQYPTGVIMHPGRREQLIEWARSTGGLIVEDDYDAEYRLRHEPIAPLRSIDTDVVAYLGSASKILAPALRLGWLLVPSHLGECVCAAHASAYAQPSIIIQSAFARLLESGELDRNLRSARAIYRARHAAIRSALTRFLPGLRTSGGAAGLHLMLWLPDQLNEDAVIAAVAQRGLAVNGLHEECAVAARLGPALLLGYGGISEQAIPEAISRLADSLGIGGIRQAGRSQIVRACGERTPS